MPRLVTEPSMHSYQLLLLAIRWRRRLRVTLEASNYFLLPMVKVQSVPKYCFVVACGGLGTSSIPHEKDADFKHPVVNGNCSWKPLEYM